MGTRQAHIVVFQSTPPAQGATVFDMVVHMIAQGFNPRPPRRGRLDRPAILVELT